jgi:hypothetical protein
VAENELKEFDDSEIRSPPGALRLRIQKHWMEVELQRADNHPNETLARKRGYLKG